MSRLLITLTVLFLLGIILPGLPILARSGKTPHENPAQATSLFDSAGLLFSYSYIASQATNGQYQSAQETLTELEKADIPDKFRYIIDRYNVLLNNLFTTLDNLEELLDDTTELLSHNRVDEARQSLESSEEAIQEADFLLKDIRAATYSLKEKMGVIANLAGDRLSQAYAHLEESITRLADLMERYKSIRHDLAERYSWIADLNPTSLSLYITPESAFVGDSVTATGSLRSANGPLAGKKISINAYDIPVGTAITRDNGYYTSNITMPLIYEDNLLLTARYEPSQDDAGIFLACRSQSVNMSTKFYPTRLEVDVPDMVHRGLPFTLSGGVSGDSSIERRINVFLDDRPLAEATVSGRFSFEVTPPADAIPGWRNLKIAVTPEWRYSGAVKRQGVTLAATMLRVETKTPAIVVLPASVDVSGMVSNGPSPLADAPVVLTLMNSSTTLRTAPDGSFSGSVKLYALPQDAPLATNPFYINAQSTNSLNSLAPIGYHRLEILTAIPGYPALTRTVIRPVVTINPLSTGLMLTFLIAAGLVYYCKKRTTTMQETEKTSPEADGLSVKPTESSPLPMPVISFTGIKSRVLAAYRNGLTTVEKITGIIMAPNATLREFLNMVHFPSPSAAARFTELTAIAESSLYAAGDPPDVIATRAEELVNIIREELYRGNP